MSFLDQLYRNTPIYRYPTDLRPPQYTYAPQVLDAPRLPQDLVQRLLDSAQRAASRAREAQNRTEPPQGLYTYALQVREEAPRRPSNRGPYSYAPQVRIEPVNNAPAPVTSQIQEVLNDPALDQDPTTLCPISQEPFEDPVKAPCGHVFSRRSIERWLPQKSECALCRASLSSWQLTAVSVEEAVRLVKEDNKPAQALALKRLRAEEEGRRREVQASLSRAEEVSDDDVSIERKKHAKKHKKEHVSKKEKKSHSHSSKKHKHKKH